MPSCFNLSLSFEVIKLYSKFLIASLHFSKSSLVCTKRLLRAMQKVRST